MVCIVLMGKGIYFINERMLTQLGSKKLFFLALNQQDEFNDK